MKPRTELSMQLYEMLLERGYHEELCDVITKNLNTDYTAARMIGYLSRYSHLPEGEVVDEMLAILSDRNALSDYIVTEDADNSEERKRRKHNSENMVKKGRGLLRSPLLFALKNYSWKFRLFTTLPFSV